MKNSKILMDDGFRPELLEGVRFDGLLEIPLIQKPEQFFIPDKMVPFSKINREFSKKNAVCFYEMDRVFADVIRNPENYLQEFSGFGALISPDVSLYRDQPLSTQIANVYRNRAIGAFYQKKGISVVPQIRWGDERTYTRLILPEPVAFLGAEKHSIVSIGTYGCIQGKENKMHFRNGLYAMLEELQPEIVLVYGGMPDSIFGEYRDHVRFVQRLDWISVKRGC